MLYFIFLITLALNNSLKEIYQKLCFKYVLCFLLILCLLNDKLQCKNKRHNFNVSRLLNYFLLKSEEIDEREPLLRKLYSVAAIVDHSGKDYGFEDFYTGSVKI